jgi:hypothetical protein
MRGMRVDWRRNLIRHVTELAHSPIDIGREPLAGKLTPAAAAVRVCEIETEQNMLSAYN